MPTRVRPQVQLPCVDESNGRPASPASSVARGFRHDSRCAFRCAGTTARRLGRRGRTSSRHPVSLEARLAAHRGILELAGLDLVPHRSDRLPGFAWKFTISSTVIRAQSPCARPVTCWATGWLPAEDTPDACCPSCRLTRSKWNPQPGVSLQPETARGLRPHGSGCASRLCSRAVASACRAPDVPSRPPPQPKTVRS